MKTNKIVLDIPNDKIIIRGKNITYYASGNSQEDSSQIRKSTVLHSDTKQVIYPGGYIELASCFTDGTHVTVEPRSDSSSNTWIQPIMITSVCSVVGIPNLTADLVTIKKH